MDKKIQDTSMHSYKRLTSEVRTNQNTRRDEQKEKDNIPTSIRWRKTGLSRNFIAIQAYFKKQDEPQINNVTTPK